MSGPPRQDGVLTPWLTPMRAARGPLRNTGLVGSLLIHLVGLICFIAVIVLLDQLFWEGDLWWEISRDFEHQPGMSMLAFGISFAAFESIYVLSAWLTMCWGSGVEPYRHSFGRSLSRWYQLTPWLALIGVGTILAFQGVEAIDDWYWDRYDYARWGDYYDVHGYDEPMQLITADRFELLMQFGRFGSLGIANLIALWWALGTVMVHRSKPGWFSSCRWPAVCEGCGYALAGLTDEQSCPECGKQVGQSKHSERGQHDLTALQMLFQGLFKPGTVGSQMVTRKATKQPLRVLLWGLLFTVLSGPVMMILIDIGHRISPDDWNRYAESFGELLEQIVMIGLTVGIYFAMFGSLMLLGAGTLVGTIVRVMGKRNIMPAACSAACYSVALLPVWLIGMGLLAMVMIPLTDYLYETNRYEIADALFFLMPLFHGSMLLFIILHIARITKAARHANI